MIFLQEIKKESATSFSILWSDGEKQEYSLAQLQRACPCSSCRDPLTGKFIKNPEDIPETLQATSMETVGNYAIRIQFVSGCSFGIYTFAFLNKIGRSLRGDNERL
jgi:DUF971 family protein